MIFGSRFTLPLSTNDTLTMHSYIKSQDRIHLPQWPFISLHPLSQWSFLQLYLSHPSTWLYKRPLITDNNTSYLTITSNPPRSLILNLSTIFWSHWGLLSTISYFHNSSPSSYLHILLAQTTFISFSPILLVAQQRKPSTNEKASYRMGENICKPHIW